MKAWLDAGQTVELRERDRKLATIIPENGRRERVKAPDAAARRKRIFGERVIPAVEILIEERESRY